MYLIRRHNMDAYAGIGFKTGAIRVNTLFDVMDTKDIGILRELEARIRGYIRGERAQAKFDFSLKDDIEEDDKA